MSRALEGELADLHGVLASIFMERLRNGECSPAEFNVIRQFLKDNAISCIGEKNETLTNIVSLLPSFAEEDIAAEG